MGLFTPKWMTDQWKTETLTDTGKLLKALDSAYADVYRTALRKLYKIDPLLLKKAVLEGKCGKYKGIYAYARSMKADYRRCMDRDELKKAILDGDPIAEGFPDGYSEEKRIGYFSAEDLTEIAFSGRLVSECVYRLKAMHEGARVAGLIPVLAEKGFTAQQLRYVLEEIGDDMDTEQAAKLFYGAEDPGLKGAAACILLKKARSEEAAEYLIAFFHEELERNAEKNFHPTVSHFEAVMALADRIALSEKEEAYLRMWSNDGAAVRLLEKCGGPEAKATAAFADSFERGRPELPLLLQINGGRALELVLSVGSGGTHLGDPGRDKENRAEAVRFLYRNSEDAKLKARIERELPQTENYSISYTYQDSEGDLRDSVDTGTVTWWP